MHTYIHTYTHTHTHVHTHIHTYIHTYIQYSVFCLYLSRTAFKLSWKGTGTIRNTEMGTNYTTKIIDYNQPQLKCM